MATNDGTTLFMRVDSYSIVPSAKNAVARYRYELYASRAVNQMYSLYGDGNNGAVCSAAVAQTENRPAA